MNGCFSSHGFLIHHSIHSLNTVNKCCSLTGAQENAQYTHSQCSSIRFDVTA